MSDLPAAPRPPDGHERTAPKRGGSIRGRAVRRVLLLAVFVAALVRFAVPKLARSSEAVDQLSRLNPLLIVIAVGLEVASLLCYTVLTRVTLPDEPRLSLFAILRIQLATKAAGNVVPGGVAGTTLGYRLFLDAGVPSSAAGFTLASTGLGSAVVLNLLLWVALLVSIPMIGFNPAYASAALVGALLLVFAAGLVYLLIEGRGWAEKVLRAIARRTPFVEEDAAARVVHQVADHLDDLAHQPRLVRRGLSWATANWLLDAAALWIVLAAFGITMNPINLFVAYGVVSVLASLPFSPGGLGVVELALPALLAKFFGVPLPTAGLAVLAWRLIQFWMPIPLGGLSYASIRLGPSVRRRLAQQPSPA